MFWSSPSADITIMIALLAVAFVTALASYYFTKRVLLGIFAFSLLGNIAIYLNIGSRIFDVYEIKYIVRFTTNIWPMINIALLLFLIYTNYIKKYGTADKN